MICVKCKYFSSQITFLLPIILKLRNTCLYTWKTIYVLHMEYIPLSSSTQGGILIYNTDLSINHVHILLCHMIFELLVNFKELRLQLIIKKHSRDITTDRSVFQINNYRFSKIIRYNRLQYLQSKL